MKKDNKKSFKKLAWFFFSNPVLFHGQDHEKQKQCGNSYQSLIRLSIIFRKIIFSVIYKLGNFYDLIQSGFWIIPKIAFAYLRKPIQDIIIIPVSHDPYKSGKHWKEEKIRNLNIDNLDIDNLHAYAMSQKLLVSCLKWVKNRFKFSKGFIKTMMMI